MEYLVWKHEQLKRWVRTPPTWNDSDTSGFGPGRTVYFNTTTSPAFDELFDLFRPDAGTKALPISLVEGLSPLSLAVWFMDDGSHSKGFLNLSTHGFEVAEVEAAAEALSRRGWLCRVQRTARGPVIGFTKDGSRAVVRSVARHVVPSLRYKVNLRAPKPMADVTLVEVALQATGTLRRCIICGGPCSAHNDYCDRVECQRERQNAAMRRWRIKKFVSRIECSRCGKPFTRERGLGRPVLICQECRVPWEQIKDGKPLPYKAIVVKCKRCGQDFSFIRTQGMSDRSICDSCRTPQEAAKMKRHRNRQRAKRRQATLFTVST